MPHYMDDTRSVRKGAIALDEMLDDIEVPSLEAPDLDASFTPSAQSKDLFAEKKRAAWKEAQQRKLVATSRLTRCVFLTAIRSSASYRSGRSRSMAGRLPT